MWRTAMYGDRCGWCSVTVKYAKMILENERYHWILLSLEIISSFRVGRAFKVYCMRNLITNVRVQVNHFIISVCDYLHMNSSNQVTLICVTSSGLHVPWLSLWSLKPSFRNTKSHLLNEILNRILVSLNLTGDVSLYSHCPQYSHLKIVTFCASLPHITISFKFPQ